MQLVSLCQDFAQIQTAIDYKDYEGSPFKLADKYAKVNSLSYPMMTTRQLSNTIHSIPVVNNHAIKNENGRYIYKEFEIENEDTRRSGRKVVVNTKGLYRSVESNLKNYFSSRKNNTQDSYILDDSERFLIFYNNERSYVSFESRKTVIAQRWWLKMTKVEKYNKIPPTFVAKAAKAAQGVFDNMWVVEPDKKEYCTDDDIFSLIDDPLLVGVLDESPGNLFLISGWLEDFSIDQFYSKKVPRSGI